MDDGYAAGPPEILFPALEKFAQNVQQQCLLVWEKTKTEVFYWDGNMSEYCTPGLTRAGVVIDGSFEPGYLCYGVPIGTDKYVEHMLEEKMIDVTKSAKNSIEVLGDERQSLWTVVRLSLSQQLDYWLQLCYPSNVQAAAMKMDSIMWKTLEVTADSSIPRMQSDEHPEGVTLISIPGVPEHSYQDWVVRQPVRLGGFGLRCQKDLSPAAFIGAAEQVLPSFVGTKGICPQLAHLLGTMEDSQQRWRLLLASGCRTERELQNAWEVLQSEALTLSQYLDLDLDVPLAVPAEGIGEGRVDGSTRKLVIEQRETLRGSALTKALKNHPNQGLRPVRIWPQMDKLSTSWLLALPGPNNGLTSPIFSQEICANLGLSSPACSDKIGQRIGCLLYTSPSPRDS